MTQHIMKTQGADVLRVRMNVRSSQIQSILVLDELRTLTL